jgi:small multidrug resistance family-3 protein
VGRARVRAVAGGVGGGRRGGHRIQDGERAHLKSLVAAEDLLVAGSRFEPTTWTASVPGPPAGGALVGLSGPVVTVAVDAVSYLLSAVGIRAIGGTEPPRRQAPHLHTAPHRAPHGHPDAENPGADSRSPTGVIRPEAPCEAAPMPLIVRSAALFVVAAIFEIGGAWLIWQGVREHRGWLWAAGGVLALGAYGFVATFQPDAHFGRILAAYGGIFVAGSILWGVIADGYRPDRWDITGALICLAGMAVIMWAPRNGG